MIIQLTTDKDRIKSIITDPLLFQLLEGQDKSVEIKDIEPNMSSNWLIVSKDEEDIGCIEFIQMTSVLAKAHIRILPKYWDKGLAHVAVKVGIQWFKENGYKTIMTWVPANCIHVLRFLMSTPFKACGQIKNGVIYNGTLVSLFIFEAEVK